MPWEESRRFIGYVKEMSSTFENETVVTMNRKHSAPVARFLDVTAETGRAVNTPRPSHHIGQQHGSAQNSITKRVSVGYRTTAKGKYLIAEE